MYLKKNTLKNNRYYNIKHYLSLKSPNFLYYVLLQLIHNEGHEKPIQLQISQQSD
jgi:hypothetical protein